MLFFHVDSPCTFVHIIFHFIIFFCCFLHIICLIKLLQSNKIYPVLVILFCKRANGISFSALTASFYDKRTVIRRVFPIKQCLFNFSFQHIRNPSHSLILLYTIIKTFSREFLKLFKTFLFLKLFKTFCEIVQNKDRGSF